MTCKYGHSPCTVITPCQKCLNDALATEKAVSDPSVLWCGMDAGSSEDMCTDCSFRVKARIQQSPGVFVETNNWLCDALSAFFVSLEYAPSHKLWRCIRTRAPE